jgi:hypothetical protein
VFVAGTPVSFYPAPVDEIILAVGFKMNINIAREHMRTLGTSARRRAIWQPPCFCVCQSPLDEDCMSRNTVYLETPDRTQDLLNIKWALRSAGYIIRSTWHDSPAVPSPKNHWNSGMFKLLPSCDFLVVIAGKNGPARPELAIMAGFALARHLKVAWIGDAVELIADLGAIQHFKDAEQFCRAIVQETYAQPSLRIAA